MNDWGLIRLIDARAGDFQAGRFYVEFEHDVETVRYRESEEDGSDELGEMIGWGCHDRVDLGDG